MCLSVTTKELVVIVTELVFLCTLVVMVTYYGNILTYQVVLACRPAVLL